MAQHVILAAQLVPQYKPIRRCNNYAVLQSIPCSLECKIVGLILLDHYLSHALTATADVPTVYLQQFWRTMSKANINTIETFMNRVGYQGVVDKLIIADLMKKFPDIPKRIEEEYHSIKDDVPLVSVYTMGNVSVQGILVPDVFLTTKIRETNDFKEYETVSPTVSASPLVSKKRKQIVGESSSPQQSLKITIKQKQTVEKNDDDSEDMIEPGSDKDNPEVVDDDDDKEREKQDDKIGALRMMCRRQGYMIQDMERKCVTTAKFWETHNKIDDILHEVVPQIAENVTNDLIEANLKPCIVNTIIEDRDAFRSEVPAFISKEFKAHAPAIIEELFKNHVQSNVIHVHPTTTTSTETESSANLQYQLYLKMKRNLQDRADDIALWEALRRKFEKSSTSNTSCREDDFHSHHDEHQDDDAPPEGEKRVKRSKTSKRSKSARDSSSKHSRKDSTTYVSKQQSQHQEWDAWEEENVVDEDEVISEDVTPELIAEF
ncbi:hypothetical protein Tco_1577542 [Tanacetum coccineum]